MEMREEPFSELSEPEAVSRSLCLCPQTHAVQPAEETVPRIHHQPGHLPPLQRAKEVLSTKNHIASGVK